MIPLAYLLSGFLVLIVPLAVLHAVKAYLKVRARNKRLGERLAKLHEGGRR